MRGIIPSRMRFRQNSVILGISIATLALAGYIAFSVAGMQTSVSGVPETSQGVPLEASNNNSPYSTREGNPSSNSESNVRGTSENTASNSVDDMASQIKSLREEVQSLQTKLENVENKTQQISKLKMNNSSSPPSSTTSEEKTKENTSVSNFGIKIDGFVYEPESSVKILSNTDLIPRTWVNIHLLDALSDETIMTKKVLTKPDGSMKYFLDLPSFLEKGTYKIKAEYYDTTDMEVLSIRNQDGSKSSSSDGDNEIVSEEQDQTQNDSNNNDSSSNSNLFTAEVDKDSYIPGDSILVTGTAKASSTVNSLLVGPQGYSNTAASQTDSQGKYTMVHILPDDANTGTWKIRVLQGDRNIEVTFKVEEK